MPAETSKNTILALLANAPSPHCFVPSLQKIMPSQLIGSSLVEIRTLLLLIGALLATGCNRFSDARLVGTWRAEDENAVGEIALRQDHSFQKLDSGKHELTTPSIIAETGTWRVERNQLILDPTVPWSKERPQHKFQLLEITKNALRMKNLEDNKSVICSRLDDAGCPDLSDLTEQHSLAETDLIGTWQIHYHTHDYQFTFEKDHLVSLSASISDQHEPLSKGDWRVAGNILIVRAKAQYDTEASETKWTVTGMGTDCFAIKDETAWPYVLTRLK